jgi:hypothetical protein
MPVGSRMLGQPSASSPTSFSVTFNSTQNPLPSATWFLGLNDGLDWQNVQSDGVKAMAGAFSNSSLFDDSTALLKSSAFSCAANQYAQGNVFKSPGYAPTNDHEVELRLRCAGSTHSITGYEILYGIQGSGSGQPYAQFVAWNGAAGLFTSLWFSGFGGVAALNDGDLVYAEIVGTVITLKVNGSTIQSYDTVSDTNKYATGQTGIGIYALPGATLASYGWKNFTTGNL